MKISFDFDETTKKISNLTVNDTKVKPKVSKKAKSNKIILVGNSLKLTEEVLELLGTSVGERLCVRFNPNPVILRPEIANEPTGGNLITKSLTVSCKGKTSELLAEKGTEFHYTLKSDGYLVLLDKDVVVDNMDTTLEEKIKKVELDDSDFSISSIKDEEEITINNEI